MRRVLVVLLIASGLATSSPAQAATHQVTVRNNEFVPKTLQIEPGDTVEWTAVHTDHTVTADDGRFDFHPGRTLDVGEKVSWTFHTEELVRYYCRRHGGPGGVGMAGIIIVGDPPGAPVPETPVVVVPDDVPTIADAAIGAQPGTQVLVRPGVYPEEVRVTVPRLEIHGLGAGPDEVILDGEHRRSIGVTVVAPGVRISNLTIRHFTRAGIITGPAKGTVVSDTLIEDNGPYGIDASGANGVAVRSTEVRGHGVAGLAVRDCQACGARVDGGIFEANATGVLAVEATGVVVRGSHVEGNAVGIVLRHVGGAQIVGNTVRDNAARNVWVASVFDGAEPATGAGVWLVGGHGNLIASNVVSGHTYNVAVTGPPPAIGHRIAQNAVGDAVHADLGWDGLGLGVCFSGNMDATSDPPGAQTLYDCALPVTAGVPYPVVTVRLLAHAAG